MIPYFNRLPYSLHPVRRMHVVMIGGFLLLFVASSYFFGALLSVRLLLLGMLLYAAGLFVFFICRAARALRTKETLTIYGPVVLTQRPILFTALLVLQVLMPLALICVLIFHGQAPHIQLFQWIGSIWAKVHRGITL
jgi:hypothetical protein